MGSKPAGYERGSARLAFERDEVDGLSEGATSLLADNADNVDEIEKRDCHDEFEENEEFVETLVVDTKDEGVELRPTNL